MPFVSASQDPDSLTLTVTAEFDAPVERVWQIWADKAQLERWWGPPDFPATFHRYEFVVGGHCRYTLNGPGMSSRGFWNIIAIEPPTRLEFEDGWADENGEPVPHPTTQQVVTLDDLGGRTRMIMVTTFADADHLNRTIEMGVEQGVAAALNQIDHLLA